MYALQMSFFSLWLLPQHTMHIVTASANPSNIHSLFCIWRKPLPTAFYFLLFLTLEGIARSGYSPCHTPRLLNEAQAAGEELANCFISKL
ncbi:hypothetical protein FKM82_006857 [Ascaphus truei]